MKISTSISLLVSALVLFATSSARAMQIDTSGLDTMKIEDVAPPALVVLHWPGVKLKLAKAYNDQITREIVTPSDVRVDTQVEMFLSTPAGTGALTRIVKAADGTSKLEHVELAIDGDNPALQVTKRSSVRLVEVARIDSGLERAKAIPIYAYRSDDQHVVLVVASAGVTVSKMATGDSQICGTGPNDDSPAPHGCLFGKIDWRDVMVDLELGPEQRIGQVHGDIVFADAPKGESNEPHSFVMNASLAKIGRDAVPILSLSTRVRETPPPSESDGEE